MPFPSPPWSMRGTMWLSLFPVRTGTLGRPTGLYGAAFVDYRQGSALTYRELVLARLVRDGTVPRVHISEVWVDSAASRDGGRALWAIPKELAELHVSERPQGPAQLASGDASTDAVVIATARFTGPRLPSLRTPVRFTVAQEHDAGTRVVTAVSGSSRTMPVLGRWDFGVQGPLAWLRGRQPVASFRLADFRMTFGA